MNNLLRTLYHALLSFVALIFFLLGGVGILFGAIFLLFQISLLLHNIEQLEAKLRPH